MTRLPPALSRILGDRAARRGQSGLSLVELLLVIAISVIIAGPLTAWMVLAVRAQGTARDELGNAAATGLLNHYFPRDIASAQLVAADPAVVSDCPGGGAASGEGGVVKLQIIPAGSTKRVTYVEADPSDGDPTEVRSLWRRECNADGTGLEAAEVFDGVIPATTTAACTNVVTPAPSGDLCAEDANRQVQIQVNPWRPPDASTAKPVVVRATRRATSASIGLNPPGSRDPLAQIAVAPGTGYSDTDFTFSAAGSTDPDGDALVSYEWTFAGNPSCNRAGADAEVTCSFSSQGSQTVLLTVTDERGGKGVSSGVVTVRNRFPTAKASVTPSTSQGSPGERGVTSFTFSAAGSSDPDGSALTYAWDLGDDLPAGDRFRSGASVDVTFPDSVKGGPRQVNLVVRDPDGGTDAAVVQVVLDDAPVAPGGIEISPTPVVTPGKVSRVGSVGPGKDLTVTFTADDGVASGWRLRRAGATAPVAESTSPTAVFSHTFANGDHGEYEIVRVNSSGGTEAEGDPVPFRVNARPVPAFGVSGVTTVAFDSADTIDPDGSILSWQWNFGFFDNWTSTEPDPVHTFTSPGIYTITLAVMDDDGEVALTTQQIAIDGVPAKPQTPTWDDWTLRWDPVPGVERYEVATNTPCGSNTYNVAPGQSPSVAMADVRETCATPGLYQGTLYVVANGKTSPPSDPAEKSG